MCIRNRASQARLRQLSKRGELRMAERHTQVRNSHASNMVWLRSTGEGANDRKKVYLYHSRSVISARILDIQAHDDVTLLEAAVLCRDIFSSILQPWGRLRGLSSELVSLPDPLHDLPPMVPQRGMHGSERLTYAQLAPREKGPQLVLRTPKAIFITTFLQFYGLNCRPTY